MAPSNADIARRGFEAVRQGDIDAVRAFLDPEVRWHGGDPSAPVACQNRDEALAFMRAARRRGGVGELVDVIEAGDRVVVVMRPSGAPPDGPAQLHANLTTFRDGRAVEMVPYEHPADALAAAGLGGRA